MKVFVDTWGWICMNNRAESDHESVVNYYRDARENGDRILTSDYVLDETFTLLFRRIPVPKAMRAMEAINEAAERGFLEVQRIDRSRFEEAQRLRYQYDDKPGISFTDFTSVAVMTECDVKTIISDDAHFTYMASGFTLEPDIL